MFGDLLRFRKFLPSTGNVDVQCHRKPLRIPNTPIIDLQVSRLRVASETRAEQISWQ